METQPRTMRPAHRHASITRSRQRGRGAMPQREPAPGERVHARFACGGMMASNVVPALRAGHSDSRRLAWTASDPAAQFRRMAEAETQATARDRLLELAEQYARLATKLDADPGVIPDP